MTPQTAHSKQQPEIRKHYYLDKYVVIAPKRGVRPHVFKDDKTVSIKTKEAPPIEKDPSVIEIPHPDGGWAVKVVDNLYPALGLSHPDAFGKQEVVLETRERRTPFCDLSTEQIQRVFEAYKQRRNALYNIRGIRYVSIFKNHGRAAGASLAHTHSQIIAMGTVPPDVESSQKAFTKEQKRLGCSPLTTILQWEEEQAQRVISADDHTVSLAPYASQFPYEVWVVPRRQVHSINDLDDQELRSVATHLKQVTTALGTVDMSYNFFLAEGLAKYKNHFMICLAPRPNIWAGFELNTGVIMHPMPPETATKWYRKTIKDVC